VVTAFSSAWLGKADIAMQNMIGSNLFNLMVLVVLDFLVRGRNVLADASPNHRSSAITGGVMMLVVASAALFFNIAQDRGEDFNLYVKAPVGLGSIILVVIYCFAMKRIFDVGRESQQNRRENGTDHTGPGNGRIYGTFVLVSLVIVAAGYRMTVLGKIISETPMNVFGREVMITDNFVGMILIAVATSLPELVVTISAARIGAINMAIGNILGSNIFNMAILGLSDIFYFHGPMLLYSGRAVFYTAMLGALLTAVALTGLGKSARRLFLGRFGPRTLIILILYIAGMGLLTKLGLLVN
jgi:cation:H+ antiporter